MIKNINDIEFIHVPKTAGTTIAAHLARLDPVRFQSNRYLYTALQARSTDPDAYRARTSFAVVRNPFDRLISIWKYERKQSAENKISADEMLIVSNFDRWLEHRHCRLDWGRAFMVLPQWHWISNWGNQQIVDMVFRYEEIDTCFDWIQDTLGIDIDRSIVLNKSSSSYNYRDVSMHSKNIMQELSKIDCERFNYDW